MRNKTQAMKKSIASAATEPWVAGLPKFGSAILQLFCLSRLPFSLAASLILQCEYVVANKKWSREVSADMSVCILMLFGTSDTIEQCAGTVE
jgi:hypothetical protein